LRRASAQKYLRKLLISMDKLSVVAFLLAIMFNGGLAWAQVGDMNLNEPEKPFLNPYSPVNGYQSVDASQTPVNSYTKSTEKVLIRPKNIGKNTLSINPTNNSNASLGKSEKRKNQPAGTKIGAIGSSSSLGGDQQPSGSGSKSFLDGYFLKSLHEGKLVTKKAKDDNTTDNNVQKNKNGSSFIK
jgi:hypothetical protein